MARKGRGSFDCARRFSFANLLSFAQDDRRGGCLPRILALIECGFGDYLLRGSSTGSDANSGTAAAAAWQTIGHVNAQTFLPGDSVLFKRGDVWNESLTPPSSGSSGNAIAFDAYGTGAAPNLTGYYSVPR